MSDLVIREEDGWIEISHLLRGAPAEFLKELWEYASLGEVGQAQNLLDMEFGGELEDLIGVNDLEGLKVVSVPDSLSAGGEQLRAWIRAARHQEAAPPSGEAEEARPVDVERELDLARNLFGRLKAPQRTRLRAVIYQPTEKTWDDAYSIIVGADGWTTLWQAVLAVDPTFPKTGPATTTRGRLVERWKKIPSQETLLKAIRYATH